MYKCDGNSSNVAPPNFCSDRRYLIHNGIADTAKTCISTKNTIIIKKTFITITKTCIPNQHGNISTSNFQKIKQAKLKTFPVNGLSHEGIDSFRYGTL